MDSGFILPYFMLMLVSLEEHYAMWFFYFFVVPLLDTFFYIHVPDKDVLNSYWCRFSMWIWFLLLAHTAFTSTCSFNNMVSMGVLYNSALCIASEMKQSGKWHNQLLELVIHDFLGFARAHILSATQSFLFFYLLLLHNRLFWHLGSVLIGSMLNRYVYWVENKFRHCKESSHHGLANYCMFRLRHSDTQLIPISHMWVFLYLQLHKLESFFSLDDDDDYNSD